MTYRIRTIMIAVALAVIAALLVMLYVTSYKRSVQQSQSDVSVYVAAKDIPAGTAGVDIVKGHLLTQESVARHDVVAGAIADPNQLAKLVLSQPLYQGEQVTLRRFATSTDEGVRSELKGTQRAVEIPGTPEQLLAGTLQPGDHVDVVANLHLPNNTDATRIVLRDLRVLTAPKAPTSGTPVGNATSVQLAVSDTQVQRLFFVVKNADWTLELRPVVNASDSAERVDTIDSVLSAGLRRSR